jgi:hypothetical protein
MGLFMGLAGRRKGGKKEVEPKDIKPKIPDYSLD